MSLVHNYNFDKEDVAIKYFNQEYNDGERMLDVWQRLDAWTDEYKVKFIIAVLESSDIPKIWQYTLKGDMLKKKRILDGGHRTRAINEFIKGDFGVPLSDGNWYFYVLESEKQGKEREKGCGQNRTLPEEYQYKFDNYKLSVTTYTDLTDKEARCKFNELNHCRPMTTSEVINSHCSFLIDFLRKEWSYFIDKEDSDDFTRIKRMFSLKKKDMERLNHMKILVSLFSLIERKGSDDQFSYCEPKDALTYIRSPTPKTPYLDTQFNKEEFIPLWNRFTGAIEKYKLFIETLEKKDFQLSNHSEAVSLFHYINTIGELTEEMYDKLVSFNNNCEIYRRDSKKYEKGLSNTKDKDIKDIKNTQTSFKTLEKEVGDDVIKWVGSFQNNGSGSTNLLKRKKILDNVLNR
jgi:hypothetical protein